MGATGHLVDRKGAENPVADNLSRLENLLPCGCVCVRIVSHK